MNTRKWIIVAGAVVVAACKPAIALGGGDTAGTSERAVEHTRETRRAPVIELFRHRCRVTGTPQTAPVVELFRKCRPGAES
jgi:hypothetical protein